MDQKKENIITVKDLSFSYENKEVLTNVNLEIEQGQILGIVGPNGAGKTTFLKIMLGLLKGYKGEIHIKCIYEESHKELHHKCFGYVPQQAKINRRFPATVVDAVEMGLYGLTGFRGPDKKEKEHIQWLLEEIGITHIKNRSINEISGGQLQRTLIARALVTKPSIIFLDEPLVGIDREGTMKFLELLLSLKNRLNLTVVMVTHDFQAVQLTADQVACLNRTIHFHKNPNRLSLEDISKAYNCNFEAYTDIETIIHHRRSGCNGDV